MQPPFTLPAIFRICVLVPAILILRLPPAAGQPGGNADCPAGERLPAEIGQITRLTDRVAAYVERVPPDEANYLRREYELAMAQHDPARFDLVVGHHLYPALRLQDDQWMLHESLTAAEHANGQAMAQHLVDAVARFTDVAASMNRYVNADLDRAQPILTRDARRSMRALYDEARERTTSALKCAIAALGLAAEKQADRAAPSQPHAAASEQPPAAHKQPPTTAEQPRDAATEPPHVGFAVPPRAAVDEHSRDAAAAPSASATEEAPAKAERPRRAKQLRNRDSKAERADTRKARRAIRREARRAARAERRREAALERQAERAAECRWLRREFLRSSRRLDRRTRNWRPPGC